MEDRVKFIENQVQNGLVDFAKQGPITPIQQVNQESQLKNLSLNKTNVYPNDGQLDMYKWVYDTYNMAGIRKIDSESVLWTPESTKNNGRAADVLSGNQIESQRLDLRSEVLTWNPQAVKHSVESFVRGGISTR